MIGTDEYADQNYQSSKEGGLTSSYPVHDNFGD